MYVCMCMRSICNRRIILFLVTLNHYFFGGGGGCLKVVSRGSMAYSPIPDSALVGPAQVSISNCILCKQAEMRLYIYYTHTHNTHTQVADKLVN